MQGENLEVVKIALAVIAPRSREDLVQRGTTSLLAHYSCGFEEWGLREIKVGQSGQVKKEEAVKTKSWESWESWRFDRWG